MITTININNRMTMLMEMENESVFQVLEYEHLRGGSNLKSSINIRNIIESGRTLKQVRIILNNSAVKIQDKALSFMKGNVFIQSSVSKNDISRFKFLNFKDIKYDLDKPLIKGTGEVFLEPSFEYFTLVQLENEEIIVNDDFFYVCEEEIDISVIMEKTAESIILEQETVKLLSLKGNGIVVLKVPVPETEILRCKLYKDRLTVDRENVILRTGKIKYEIEKHLSNNKVKSEELFNVYSGIGEIWMIPVKSIYDEIEKLYDENMEEDYGEGDEEEED